MAHPLLQLGQTCSYNSKCLVSSEAALRGSGVAEASQSKGMLQYYGQQQVCGFFFGFWTGEVVMPMESNV